MVLASLNIHPLEVKLLLLILLLLSLPLKLSPLPGGMRHSLIGISFILGSVSHCRNLIGEKSTHVNLVTPLLKSSLCHV